MAPVGLVTLHVAANRQQQIDRVVVNIMSMQFRRRGSLR
jgi:hypothetical protein